MFSNIQHQTRFETMRVTGWYDPNTRDENFICELLVHYGKTERCDEVFEYMLKSIPITNNVFNCLYRLKMDVTINNQSIITDCFNRLPKSRMEELNELYD